MRVYRRVTPGYCTPMLTTELATEVTQVVLGALELQLVRELVEYAVFEADTRLFTGDGVDYTSPVEHLAALRFAQLMDNPDALRERLCADIIYRHEGDRVRVLVAHDMRTSPDLSSTGMSCEGTDLTGEMTVGEMSALLGPCESEQVLRVSPALGMGLFEDAWVLHSPTVIESMDRSWFTRTRRVFALCGAMGRRLPLGDVSIKDASDRLKELSPVLAVADMLNGPLELSVADRRALTSAWYGR